MTSKKEQQQERATATAMAEADPFWDDKQEGQQQEQIQKRNTGILRFAQNDGILISWIPHLAQNDENKFFVRKFSEAFEKCVF
jgi:hypothetical protein